MKHEMEIEQMKMSEVEDQAQPHLSLINQNGTIEENLKEITSAL